MAPILLSAVVAALPAAAHGPDARPTQVAAVPSSGKVTVVAREFKFEPDAIDVKQGQHVTILFRNEGKLSHNLAIPELGLHTDTIQGGKQETLDFVAKKTGTYAFWCAVPGHKQAGMRGKVVVDH
ncbi:MAG TPA: cupredoxin domain-containing protein [Alphaproteobacteria bacterium]|nr:cupredoxin domain-containing protein [Alphaproteobacteria bacterium]